MPNLILEVTIYDKKGKRVKSYSSSQKMAAHSAMHWGYSMVGAGQKYWPGGVQRVANAKTFSAALSDIVGQINQDVAFINKELQNGN